MSKMFAALATVAVLSAGSAFAAPAPKAAAALSKPAAALTATKPAPKPAAALTAAKPAPKPAAKAAAKGRKATAAKPAHQK